MSRKDPKAPSRTTTPNGKAFGIPDTPRGIATRGDSMHGPWYDNDGNVVKDPRGGPMEKYANG